MFVIAKSRICWVLRPFPVHSPRRTRNFQHLCFTRFNRYCNFFKSQTFYRLRSAKQNTLWKINMFAFNISYIFCDDFKISRWNVSNIVFYFNKLCNIKCMYIVFNATFWISKLTTQMKYNLKNTNLTPPLVKCLLPISNLAKCNTLTPTNYRYLN